MTGAASALLAVPLRLGAVDLAARQGLMRPQARVRHLANVSLVHQVDIDFCFKDISWQFDTVEFFPSDIPHRYFHVDYSWRPTGRP